MNVALKEKNIALRDQLDKISDQEKQISLLYNDNVKWEEKHKEQLKDNENFKKWANWDNDLIDSFKKIEILNNELAETKKNLDKFSEENKNFREQNQKLTENLEKTKKNEEILRSEVLKLNVNKDKCEQLEAKMKDYVDTKKQNENYRIQLEGIKDEYETKIINEKNDFDTQIEKLKSEHETKIEEITTQNNIDMNNLKDEHEINVNKLNEEIQSLKDEITILNDNITKKDKNYEELTQKMNKTTEELNGQIEKKNEVLSNLKKSYENLSNKLKVCEEKLVQYEENNKKHKSAFDFGDSNTNNNSNDNTSNNNTNNNDTNNTDMSGKVKSTFDQFSFTKEVLNDYLFCLYLLEKGISIQTLVSNIIGSLSLYSKYSFKLNKIGNKDNTFNYPLGSIQNEILEDIYFMSFDKYISKKILFNKNEVFIDGILDKKILKANFEDFDQATIAEICIELINKNIITKLKAPKTLKEISQLCLNKYNKKFDFEGTTLNDFLNKEIIPFVSKKILAHDKSIIDEMRTLVELSLHNIHDGKVVIDGEEVYNFEIFFENYNRYTNVPERNLKIDITNGICDLGEGVDNIKHSLKYYFPQILRFDKCFLDNEHLGYTSKILASINYYQANVTQLSFNNNKLDKIFNNNILNCIKLLKTLIMLDLSNNGLVEDNIKELFDYLKQNKTIKILFLNNNNLPQSCGYYLADSFKKNTTLEILHLAHNNINKSGLDSILSILGNDNKTLKELDISYNELTYDDFKSLSDYLNLNPPLKSLDISGNELITKSSNLIGVTFKKLTNLEEIKLNKCGINDESAPNVLMYLNESSIQSLEIDDNKFGMMAPMLILKKITDNTKLKYISFQKMEFQPYFVGMIIDSLNKNKSIERVNLKQNKISEDDLKKFVDAATKIKTIKFIFSRDMVPSNANEIIGQGNKNIVLQ